MSCRPRWLNRRSKVYLKLENLQPSGSFKTRFAGVWASLIHGLTASRGIGHYMTQRIQELPHDAAVHFYCSSGGNAGMVGNCD